MGTSGLGYSQQSAGAVVRFPALQPHPVYQLAGPGMRPQVKARGTGVRACTCTCVCELTCPRESRRPVHRRPEASGWSLSPGQNLPVPERDPGALPNSQTLTLAVLTDIMKFSLIILMVSQETPPREAHVLPTLAPCSTPQQKGGCPRSSPTSLPQDNAHPQGTLLLGLN